MRGVHIRQTSLDRPSGDVTALYDLLDPAERARAAKFRNERDRRRFVVTRGTLRILLSEYTALPPDGVPLRILPGGKPALDDREFADSRHSDGSDPASPVGQPLHFSLSHCGDLAMFAFSDGQVGIDVECLDMSSDMSRVAAHFFAPEETRVFRALEGVERTSYFVRTWVRKEAYVKACGRGFALDPARVIVAASSPGGVRLAGEDGVLGVDDRFVVHDLAEFDGHFAAVAVDSRAE